MVFRVSEIFSFNDNEKKKAEQWLEEHVKKCEKIRPPARRLEVSGGRVSYIFTPTSVGVGVSVRCTCGEEFDVTDCDSW